MPTDFTLHLRCLCPATYFLDIGLQSGKISIYCSMHSRADLLKIMPKYRAAQYIENYHYCANSLCNINIAGKSDKLD